MDEQTFRIRCDEAFDSLKKRMLIAADLHGFEVEGEAGKLEVIFEDPEETKFVISPQTPVRQIWISALSTSFKLAWSDEKSAFVLPATGETLHEVMARILTQQLGVQITV